MNASTQFWNKSAHKYADSPIKDLEAYEHKLSITQRYFSTHADVFEFGCGTGSTALIHAPFTGSYTAIDSAHTMIDIAKQKPKPDDINLTFDVASLEAYQADDQSYDVILGMNTLHLLEDVDSALRRVYDLLKPNGVFVSTTACLADKVYLKPLLWLGWRLKLVPKVAFLSRSDLEKKLTLAGFDIDYRWAPEKAPYAYFLVAKKRG